MAKTLQLTDIEQESREVFIEYIFECIVETNHRKLLTSFFESVVEINEKWSFGLTEDYFGLWKFDFIADIEDQGENDIEDCTAYRVQKIIEEKTIKITNYVKL